jgi:hypothetical protein
MRLVVQFNLSKQYAIDIENACKVLGYEFIPVEVVPFSKEVPDIDNDKPTLFYGATKWINNIYLNNRWRPGVYFNPESTCPVWFDKYKEAVLNYGAEITTLENLSIRSYDSSRLLFIRPIKDLKEFNGDVWEFGNLKRWSRGIATDLSTKDLAQIPIVVAEPCGIAQEWRTFIVGGKVSSASLYRRYHNLFIDKDVPNEVIEFAEAQAKIYSPSEVFVMDVGESAGKLYIIEIGCFNSAGFYAADVQKIIKDVSEFSEAYK